MSHIRSKYTKLDLEMEKLLKRNDLPYAMYPKIEGNPDFIVGKKVIIFCDSSFWHGKDWVKLKKRLKSGSNSEYWIKHILRNKKRDREVNSKLKSLGFVILRFWDEEVAKHPFECILKIREKLD